MGNSVGNDRMRVKIKGSGILPDPLILLLAGATGLEPATFGVTDVSGFSDFNSLAYLDCQFVVEMW